MIPRKDRALHAAATRIQTCFRKHQSEVAFARGMKRFTELSALVEETIQLSLPSYSTYNSAERIIDFVSGTPLFPNTRGKCVSHTPLESLDKLQDELEWFETAIRDRIRVLRKVQQEL